MPGGTLLTGAERRILASGVEVSGQDAVGWTEFLKSPILNSPWAVFCFRLSLMCAMPSTCGAKC